MSYRKGVKTLSDGSKYEGVWRRERYDKIFKWKIKGYDKYGKIILEINEGNGKGLYVTVDGHKYEGKWKNGDPHGQGTRTWKDGETYVGEWKDGRSWNGTQYDKDGKITHKWMNGKRIKQ